MPSTRRWVVKIGSALLTSDGQGLNRAVLAPWVDQMTELRRSGADLVLVSSGAVAEGMARMGWKRRPKTLHELQAAAAIGQMGLIRAYEDCFDKRGLRTAQVLLTRDVLIDRHRFLNARTTLRTLLSLGVIVAIRATVTGTSLVAARKARYGGLRAGRWARGSSWPSWVSAVTSPRSSAQWYRSPVTPLLIEPISKSASGPQPWRTVVMPSAVISASAPGRPRV